MGVPSRQPPASVSYCTVLRTAVLARCLVSGIVQANYTGVVFDVEEVKGSAADTVPAFARAFAAAKAAGLSVVVTTSYRAWVKKGRGPLMDPTHLRGLDKKSIDYSSNAFRHIRIPDVCQICCFSPVCVTPALLGTARRTPPTQSPTLWRWSGWPSQWRGRGRVRSSCRSARRALSSSSSSSSSTLYSFRAHLAVAIRRVSKVLLWSSHRARGAIQCGGGGN